MGIDLCWIWVYISYVWGSFCLKIFDLCLKLCRNVLYVYICGGLWILLYTNRKPQILSTLPYLPHTYSIPEALEALKSKPSLSSLHHHIATNLQFEMEFYRHPYPSNPSHNIASHHFLFFFFFKKKETLKKKEVEMEVDVEKKKKYSKISAMSYAGLAAMIRDYGLRFDLCRSL